MTGGRSWRRTPIRQQKRTPPNNQGGVGRQQQQRSMHNFVKELDEICIYEQLQPALDANPQENYDIFIKLVSSAKNKHLPKKIVRFNKKKHKKAKWLTNGILKSINIKDKMYKILAKADNVNEAAYTNLKAEFNAYKKTLRRSINEAKRLYYMRTFELYRNDIKQTGSVIGNTLQKNARCPDSTKFVLNNRMITNLDEIANEFNIYFINIGRLLNDQMQAVTSSNDYLLQHNKTETTFNFVSVNEVYIDNVINKLKNKSSYGYDTISNKHIKYARNVLTKPLTLLINQCIHTGIYPDQLKLTETTFNFVSVNEVYIDNVINKLKNKSSYGYDTISNKHIKYARNVLTKPLTLLINQCIHTGIYPDQLKLSRVKPLHKSGDKTQFGNYRPIALLPKIFERVMFDQLLAYLSNNNLLCVNQFGFRPGHSTELAV